MKAKAICLLVGTMLALTACSSDNKNESQTNQPETLTAKDYVDNNIYIDVKDYGEPLTPERKDDPERTAQMKAANYRFFSHVTIVDNQYVCDLTSADQINISPAMFAKMMENMKQCNADVRAKEAEGRKIELGPLGEDYLNSLLDENSLLNRIKRYAAENNK